MQMNPNRVLSGLLHGAIALCLLLVGMTARAAPVTLNYSGSVSGYQFQDALLSPFIPTGTSMTLSLTFNETYSDRTYDFTDNLGPVSGTMTVGALTPYVFGDYVPTAAGFDSTGLLWVGTMFTGSGPVPSNADLYGLILAITPDMTLFSNPQLGFGWTTQYSDGFSITNYGYVEFTGQGTITRANQVPEPASIALLGIGFLGLVASRRHRN